MFSARYGLNLNIIQVNLVFKVMRSNYIFWAHLQNNEKLILAPSCLSVRPSVRPRGTDRLQLDKNT